MKPQGIVDYLSPWFILLFCFLAGYFLNTVIEDRINLATSLEVSSHDSCKPGVRN